MPYLKLNKHGSLLAFIALPNANLLDAPCCNAVLPNAILCQRHKTVVYKSGYL